MACCTVATAANLAARRSSSATSSVVNELHRHRTRYHAGPDAFLQEEPDRCPAALAIVECPVIHVHPDERIRLASVEATRKPHRLAPRVLAAIGPVTDARLTVSRDF